jgi:hypothetical protein
MTTEGHSQICCKQVLELHVFMAQTRTNESNDSQADGRTGRHIMEEQKIDKRIFFF